MLGDLIFEDTIDCLQVVASCWWLLADSSSEGVHDVLRKKRSIVVALAHVQSTELAERSTPIAGDAIDDAQFP